MRREETSDPVAQTPDQTPCCTVSPSYMSRRCHHSACFVWSLRLTSCIHFPPKFFSVEASSSFSSSAVTSSPPPILFPLTSTFGTVRRPMFSLPSLMRAQGASRSSGATHGGARPPRQILSCLNDKLHRQLKQVLWRHGFMLQHIR